MKRLFKTVSMILFSLALAACAASSTSSMGVNCNYTQDKPLWEMPLDCQGGR